LGAILYEFAVSVLLASWWVLLIGLLATILLLVRTLLEDKTLQNELGGYPEYAQQVRYRLIPGIW
jgi:protein-S-isoprenylcysteine O-methyltransferase Ste14